jgi:hypothetical protein
MSAMHSIWEDLLDDVSFGLFAIHCQLEDHSLAFALNSACGFKLSRTRNDLELDSRVLFPVFYWKDELNFRTWTLFKNQGSSTVNAFESGLFSEQTSELRHYLIPEKKEVDYFLKIEGEIHPSGVLEKLLKIPRIITAYHLESSALKSKYNLIF